MLHRYKNKTTAISIKRSPSKTFENNSNNATTSSLGSNLTHAPSTYNYNYNNRTKSISISIESSQNIVNGNGTSTVKAIANDAATGKRIENAIVKLSITFTSNGTSKEIVGHNGEDSVELKPNSSSNNNLSFKATAEAFAPDYTSTSKTTTSSSSSMSTSTSTVTSKINNQFINSSILPTLHNVYLFIYLCHWHHLADVYPFTI